MARRSSPGRAASARAQEQRALRLLDRLRDARAELSTTQDAAFEALVVELNALRTRRRSDGMARIDKMITEEIIDLLQKYRKAKQSQSPPQPDDLWAIVEEMLKLLLKLVTKAWYLQEMVPPEYPRPPKPIPAT